jgi:prepilin-type N-terminal cleavage/methylation domain-containing protein
MNARGFTLLEVILSLAILAGSLAALGEVMRRADQDAALARDETQAQVLAASIMDELISGFRPLAAVGQAVIDPTIDPPWLCSISIEDTAYVELIAVRVLVEQQLEPQLQPARFELLRWLPNPDYIPPVGGGAESGSSSGGQEGQP